MTRLDSAAIEVLRARVDRDVDEGTLPAAQIALAVDGGVAFAHHRGCGPDDRLPMFSSAKVLVAAATWRLLGAGELDVDTKAVEVLPWFTGAGKDEIGIGHLLEHTAGLPRAPLGPPEWFEPQSRQERMASWFTETIPGEHFAYHPTSAHWVLAEVVASLHGTDHNAAVHDLVTAPMGLPRMLGVDDTEVTVVDLVPVAGEGSPALDLGEVTDEALLRFNRSEVRRLGVPGGGGFARAADVAMLYQHLLHDRLGLFEPEILRAGTAELRVALPDELRGVAANRTLGLILAGDDDATMRGFGKGVSARAFGHDGAAGQVAWADPASGLSCCFLGNAIDANLVRQFRRAVGISTRAAACVAQP